MNRSERTARLLLASEDPFPPVQLESELGEAHFAPAIPPEIVARYPHRWMLLRREGDNTVVVNDAERLELLFEGADVRPTDVSAFVRAPGRSYS